MTGKVSKHAIATFLQFKFRSMNLTKKWWINQKQGRHFGTFIRGSVEAKEASAATTGSPLEYVYVLSRSRLLRMYGVRFSNMFPNKACIVIAPCGLIYYYAQSQQK